MDDSGVGYKRPPKSGQFKPGKSGNPAGRPKKVPTPLAEKITEVFFAPMEYRERGKVKVAPRHEVCIRMEVDRAIAGDIVAAENVLRIRERAARHGDAGLQILEIHDWLPDSPAQSAEDKESMTAAGLAPDRHHEDFDGPEE